MAGRGSGALRQVAILLLLAILFAALAFFFWGRSVFRQDFVIPGLSLGNQEKQGLLSFSGEANAAALGLTPEERRELLRFLQEKAPAVKHAEIVVSRQDSYARMLPDTELYMDVILRMEDGAVLKPPTTRLIRKELTRKIVWRVQRDLKAYEAGLVRGGSRQGVVIINTY